MGLNLKKLIVGRVLRIAGILFIAISSLAHHAQWIDDRENLVIVILGGLSFILGLFNDSSANKKEAKLAWRWWRLGLNIFPENAGERKALLPFAESMLHYLGSNFLVAKNRRKVAEEKLAHGEANDFYFCLCPSTPMKTYSFLMKRRERQREFDEDRIRKSIAAEEASRIYLKHWDLFKAMDMLPRKPATATYDGVWNSPTEFLESLPPASLGTENSGTDAMSVQTT